MSDADVKMPPLPEPAAWRWPVRKLRGVEWRYTLYETRRNAVPLYTADQLRAAILAERERCAKVCKEAETCSDIEEPWVHPYRRCYSGG